MNENSAKIQAAYEVWSRTYDVQDNPTRDLDAFVLKRLVPDLVGKTVVEVGCGTGKNSQWLAPQCGQLIALDFSPAMLKIAQEKMPDATVEWHQCDILQAWPVADGVADLVLFNLVLEHIEQMEPVFASAVRVMKPGAWLVLSEYHPQRIIDGDGARIETADGEIESFVGSFLHTAVEYEAVAQKAGLQIQSRAEWWKPNAGQDSLPLIISYTFRKR